jgi:hypothetical protein
MQGIWVVVGLAWNHKWHGLQWFMRNAMRHGTRVNILGKMCAGLIETMLVKLFETTGMHVADKARGTSVIVLGLHDAVFLT